MSKILNRILVITSSLLAMVLFLGLEKPVLPQIGVLELEDDIAFSIPETKETELLALSSLATHFPDEKTVAHVLEKIEESVAPPVDRDPRYTNELKYISYAVRDRVKSYYFKESTSGRIHQISPGSENTKWEFLSDEGDYFLLKNTGTIWKVRK